MRGQHHAPAALYPGKESIPIVQEAVWAPGPVWTGAENLAATGIRPPDRQARSQSLYRLRYPAHTKIYTHENFMRQFMTRNDAVFMLLQLHTSLMLLLPVEI